jgi:hypothetical protein
MSDADDPPDLPAAPPPLPRNGCLTALMILVGIVLLLPGLCAVIFIVSFSSPSSHYDPGVTPFVLIGLLAGAGGAMLIWRAVRRPP